jgi:DNA-binding IclR family transcriptional regulator
MPRKAATPSPTDHHAALGGAAAVDRALAVLQTFKAGDAPLSLAELALRTGLYKSTVLRLLASLEHAMLVERLPAGYVLGRGVARLHAVYAASFSLERMVLPALKALVAITGESAALHVLWGSGAQAQRLSLFRVDSSQPIRDHYKAGDMLPLDSGVGAIILLAYSDHLTMTLGEKILKDVENARLNGFMAAIGHRDPEVAGIAAPVFKGHSPSFPLATPQAVLPKLEGALILSMPATRYSDAHIAPVREAAARLSGLLG